MFPTTIAASSSKKRTAGALENPEPSSPKVTCIGQVRVKSKKKKKHAGRKLRNPSRRRSGSGDGSFRRTDNWGSVDLNSSQNNNIPEDRHRNQRWVHLPLTICGGLKGLGAEICCLLPCRSSSCFSSSSSERESRKERSIRRSNLEEIEISREKLHEAKLDATVYWNREEDEEEEEEEGRVSMCVPPKNALLLMRCRSDPMKMAALSRRLLESPLPNGDEREENGDADFEEKEETQPARCSQANADVIITPVNGNENLEVDSVIDMMPEAVVEEEGEHFDEDKSGMDEELEEEESEERKEEEESEERKKEEEEKESEERQEEEDGQIDSTMEEEVKEIDAGSLSGSGKEEFIEIGEENKEEFIEIGEENKEEELESVVSVSSDSDLAMESTKEMESVEEKATDESIEEKEEEEREVEKEEESESHISGSEEQEKDPVESGEREKLAAPLPDCLLLMMCEPKVSMEVSKETWVCTTDFMRYLPERRRRPANKTLADDVDEAKKKKKVDANTKLELKQQPLPPRSSCSIPGTAPVLTAQKLPRCKSEPMRTAAAKLVPTETCMWKSRKVEPLRRASVGVGSGAGVGF